MTPYFPRQTVEWGLQDLPHHRRFTLSIVMMGLVTGIGVRLLRFVVLTMDTPSWLAVGVTFAAIPVLIVGMLTLHLANFPVRRWWWRSMLFGTIAAAGEIATSAVLVAMGREPMGTGRADAGDLLRTAAALAWERPLLCGVFALALGLVVQAVRTYLVKKARVSGHAFTLDDDLDAAAAPQPPKT